MFVCHNSHIGGGGGCSKFVYHNAHIGKVLLMLIVILLAPNFKEKEKRLVDSLSV